MQNNLEIENKNTIFRWKIKNNRFLTVENNKKK